jgi:uracil-DNA glycosylase
MPFFPTSHLNDLILAYYAADIFNPYAEYDLRFDLPDAAGIRLNNVRRYLYDYQHARIALIGEAAGYKGCRFTGIPFTCEAQLREWDDPHYRTTSLCGDHDERSARCVWQVIGQRRDVILWNVFPWHPHTPNQPMTNREPTKAETHAGMQVLEMFLNWLRPEQVIAAGRVAERALHEMNVRATYVRHPSHGGQHAFQSALHSLLSHES